MNRILALDVFRGITIAGMIVFNTSSGYHYPPLDHAPWIGLTLADMAFPLFMFIMGVTTFLSLSKRGFEPSGPTIRKIVSRTLGIILVCWAFDYVGQFLWQVFSASNANLPLADRLWNGLNSLDTLRLSGVLVRLALCYGACALFAVFVNHRRFPWIILGILAIYEILLLSGHGFERTEQNILGIIDRTLLGKNHMYNDLGIDPEGILSTLPGIAHTMIGFCVGKIMFRQRRTDEDLCHALLRIMLLGAALLLGGYIVSLFIPVSKKIWSPSYVLIMCGIGSLLLGLMVYLLDLKHLGRKCVNFFCVLGANPLFLYLLSEAVLWPLIYIRFTIEGQSINLWNLIFYHGLVPIFGLQLGDLVFALLNVAFCALVGWVMYRRKIFIKL